MPAKKVSFLNSRKQKLIGVLHAPKRKASSIIILAHGFSSDKDEKGTFVKLAEALCNAGFAVLRFDFAGLGESQGRLEDLTITNEIDDLRAAISFARKGKYGKIGLLGASFGGSVSLLASPGEKIDSLAVWNPVVYLDKTFSGALKRHPVKRTKLTRRFISDMKKYDIFSSAKKISAPLFILHGENDAIIPYSQSWDLFKSVPGAKLEILKNAQHNFHGEKDRPVALQLTVNWFSQTLSG